MIPALSVIRVMSPQATQLVLPRAAAIPIRSAEVIVGLGLSHGVLRPNVKKMHALMRDLVAMPPATGAAGGRPPQVDEIERRARTVGTTSAVLNLLLVVILYLMIWRPGL